MTPDLPDPEALKKPSAATLRQVAAFQMDHGNYQTAEHLMRIAVWLEPGNGRNWKLQANCLARMDKPREAMKVLVEAKKQGVSGLGRQDLVAVALSYVRIGMPEFARQHLTMRSPQH